MIYHLSMLAGLTAFYLFLQLVVRPYCRRVDAEIFEEIVTSHEAVESCPYGPAPCGFCNFKKSFDEAS